MPTHIASVHPASDPANALSVLYLGRCSGTSRHRVAALVRLGHRVRTLDPDGHLPLKRVRGYLVHRIGASALGALIRNRVLAEIANQSFDVIWVDGGELFSPELISDLKQRTKVLVNLNVDDPYGPRDGNKWQLYRRSVPLYDLIAVVRDCNVPEAYQLGAKDVIRVSRSADEVAHAPRHISATDRTKWESDVAFIGTWMPERGPFFARLIEQGVPLTIWGERWMKADEARILQPHWRGCALYDEHDYAMAIQCAKVCIGFLSKGNRDLCTQRSFEIPYLGGVLCAERTTEHSALYKEDAEAVFWRDADECAEKCQQLLNDEDWRSGVARNGQLRCLRNQTTNEVVMAQIISRVTQNEAADVRPVV